MGQLILFCPGVNIQILPAEEVKNILVNVMDNGHSDKAIDYAKGMFSSAGTINRFQDSGGYQVLVGEINHKTITCNPTLPIIRSKERINISPLHVVQVASKLEPTIMTSLDFPIKKLSDKMDQEEEFLKKLGFNVVWAMQTASLREKHCPHVQLLIPVQCYTIEQFDIFSKLINGVSHDGLSMPIRNLSLPEIALFLLRFYQIGIRNVHILGSTGFFLIALISFFARHYFSWTSLDATTWRIQAQHQVYLNPHDLSNEYIGNEVLIDESLPMICQCPFCVNRDFTYIKNLPYSDKVDHLRCHNFYVTEKACETLFDSARTLGGLENNLRRRSPKTKKINELIECLSTIDFLKNRDINIIKPFFNIAA